MRSTPNKLTSGTYKSGTVRVYVYLATTQTGWLVCVMTAASHHAAWGVTYALIATVGHLLFARRPTSEARIVITVTVSGWLWDSAVAHSGLLVYPNGVFLKGTAPYWLAGLWALFAIQLNTVLHWLRARPLISALVGAFAGPASFRAGAALGPFISGSGRSARRCRNRLGDHLAGRACDCKPLGWRNAPFSCTNRRRRHERRPRRIEPGASQAGFISDHAKHANRSH